MKKRKRWLPLKEALKQWDGKKIGIYDGFNVYCDPYPYGKEKICATEVMEFSLRRHKERKRYEPLRAVCVLLCSDR